MKLFSFSKQIIRHLIANDPDIDSILHMLDTMKTQNEFDNSGNIVGMNLALSKALLCFFYIRRSGFQQSLSSDAVPEIDLQMFFEGLVVFWIVGAIISLKTDDGVFLGFRPEAFSCDKPPNSGQSVHSKVESS
ncbi:hypothetical protein D3C87_1744370 [compost metagenome]